MTMAIRPTTRMPAKISRQTWAPRDDNLAISSCTGGGTRLTSALPFAGRVRRTLLPSAVHLTKAPLIGLFIPSPALEKVFLRAQYRLGPLTKTGARTQQRLR